MKRLLVALLFLSILIEKSFGAPPGCQASPATTAKITVTAIKTLYNVFPIRIAGIEVLDWKGLEDVDPIKSQSVFALWGLPLFQE